MFTIWHVFLAFIVGGTCGMLVMALLQMAAPEPRRDPRDHDPQSVSPWLNRPSQV